MAVPVILVEATVRRPEDGAPVTVRLAGGGAKVPYRYGDQHWRAGIASLPRAGGALDFDGEQLGGGGVTQSLELSFAPGTSSALAEVTQFFWNDAPIVVRIGPEDASLALPPIDTAGLVLETAVENGTLRIALADQGADLKRPVLVDRFAGTGGIEGPVEWDGLIRTRAWGRCFNVPGRLIDKANNVVCFGDPRRRWQSFDQVRDRGVAAAADTLTLLAWQGSPEATFSALQQAQAVAGGGVLCPSIACAKWWTVPAGDLRADIRGETDGGYVETAPEIAARIVAARSTLPIGPAALADAIAARGAPFGWRIDSENTTAAEALSDLLAGVSLSWLVLDNAIEFRRWEWTASTRVARSVAVTRRQVFKPVATRKLGYHRNAAPMSRSDIAATVLESDGTYPDGTPYADLQPAEAGADVTGNNTAKDTAAVAGRPAVEILQLLNLNGQNILGETLRGNALAALIDARTYLDGVAIGTVITQVSDRQQTDSESFAQTLALIGAKNAGGTAFIANADSVIVSGTGLTARSLRSITADVDGHEAFITDVRDIIYDQTGATLRSINLLNADGAITGTVNTLTGEVGAYTIYADIFRIVNPNGGQAFTPFQIGQDGVVEMLDVRVRNLAANSVTVTAIAGGLSASPSFTAGDVAIGASEVTLIETAAFDVGTGGVAGNALAMVSFVQDGTTQTDTSARIRVYVDTGTGYAVVKDRASGIRTSGGDTYWSLQIGIPIRLSATATAKIKVTAQGQRLGGGGQTSGSYARDIAVDILTMRR